MEEEEKGCSGFPVGRRSRSICSVCLGTQQTWSGSVEPCWEPQAAPKAGCFGKTSSQQAQLLHQELEESWRTCSIQTTCPTNRRKNLALDVMDSPGKGEAVILLTHLIFRSLRGFSFEDIHPNVYICCHLMFLLMIIHSSSRVTPARPLGP